jgi:hypothetical protein
MALRAERRHRRISASAVVRSHRGERPTWGLAAPSRRRLQGAQVLFAKLRNNPGPRRAGFSRRVRHGRGHDPAEGQAQVAADVVFAKLRNDPPVGFGTGGGTTRRKERHRSRRTWFCEIAQRPSRRVCFRETRNNPARVCQGLRPDSRDGSRWHRQGRRAGFRETRNDPARACQGLHPGGRDGSRWHRRGRMAGSGLAMAARAAVAVGVVFAKTRNDPRGKRPRACPRVKRPRAAPCNSLPHWGRHGALVPADLPRGAWVGHSGGIGGGQMARLGGRP